MPSFETLLAFGFVVLIVELTPGPNMAYLAVLSASRGRRAGSAATVGIALGLATVGVIAAAGVASLIAASRMMSDALRVAGILYMLWLAYESWQDEAETGPGTAPDDGALVLRGFLSNVLNPKAAVFFVTLLPRFIDDGRPVTLQAVTLSLIYVAVATAIHTSIVVAAGAAAPFLRSPGRVRLARRISAALLVCVAVWFALKSARA